MRRVLRFVWATRRRRILLVGGVLMVVFSLVSVELTSRSSFCKSCHIMGDYYDSWKTSSHACVRS